MKRNDQRGVSLLELIVGLGLTSLLVYGFMTFTKNVSVKERKSLEKVYSKADSRVFSEFVKKAISRGI